MSLSMKVLSELATFRSQFKQCDFTDENIFDNSYSLLTHFLDFPLWENRINYSHLSNNRGGWNKRGGSAKAAKSINVEV